MYKIIGYKRNTGKLDNGKEWENFTLFCTKEDPTVDGLSTEIIKVKPEVLKAAFPDSNKVLGASVGFSMDVRRYNGVPKVIVTSIIKY